MKVLLGIVFVTAIATTNPANGTISNGNRFMAPTVTVLRPKTAIPSARVFVSAPRPKLLRSKPQRAVNWVDDDDDVLMPSYRRRDLQKIDDSDTDLSEYIQWRLFLARHLALMKYQEIHGTRTT
jgi:hypothetical protein